MPIANPAAIKASGGDYTTIQAWEDALVNNEGILVGECYGEVYAAVGFGGVAFNATNYPYLRPVAGQEHDGRAHEVSAKGNARIESTVATTVIGISYVDYVRIGWLEIKGPGSGNNRAINGTGSYNYFHHLIIHDN